VGKSVANTVNPVQFIKDYLVPGSAWFLIIAGTVCAGLMYGSVRMRRLGRALLAVLMIAYWVMSLPIVASTMQRLQQGPEVGAPAGIPDAPLTIVLLGNGLGGYAALGGRIETPLGQTAMNTLFALERYRKYPASTIVASGGPSVDDGTPEAAVMRDALLRNGVPPERIVLEASSGNTREQAIATAAILKGRGEQRCIVVTSPQQMQRAADVLRREGVEPFALPAGSLLYRLDEHARWWEWITPSTVARAISRDVIYELMAWPYYKARGWVN
jgi:uncharacterized SAM-binding protein YcdF (DUF218 family)